MTECWKCGKKTKYVYCLDLFDLGWTYNSGGHIICSKCAKEDKKPDKEPKE